MWSRFVAVGDSFTEGLDDRLPDGAYRGWADLVASRLAGESPDLQYANLAVRGRLLGPILAEQVPAALAMRPDLVSIAGGGNDILRPRCDLAQVGTVVRTAVADLAASGATVIVFAGFNPTRLPLGGRLRNRALVLNAHARRAAADFGATLVDLWNLPGLYDPAVWSEDRLHLNSVGHRRVAIAVLDALGLKADLEQLESAEPVRARWVDGRMADVRWSRHPLAPWVVRRIRGQSSGDDVEPKRPVLMPVTE